MTATISRLTDAPEIQVDDLGYVTATERFLVEGLPPHGYAEALTLVQGESVPDVFPNGIFATTPRARIIESVRLDDTSAIWIRVWSSRRFGRLLRRRRVSSRRRQQELIVPRFIQSTATAGSATGTVYLDRSYRMQRGVHYRQIVVLAPSSFDVVDQAMSNALGGLYTVDDTGMALDDYRLDEISGQLVLSAVFKRSNPVPGESVPGEVPRPALSWLEEYRVGVGEDDAPTIEVAPVCALHPSGNPGLSQLIPSITAVVCE